MLVNKYIDDNQDKKKNPNKYQSTCHYEKKFRMFFFKICKMINLYLGLSIFNFPFSATQNNMLHNAIAGILLGHLYKYRELRETSLTFLQAPMAMQKHVVLELVYSYI